MCSGALQVAKTKQKIMYNRSYFKKLGFESFKLLNSYVSDMQLFMMKKITGFRAIQFYFDF